MTDVLALIDETLAGLTRCGECDSRLRARSSSLLFCDEACQKRYYGRAVVPLPEESDDLERAVAELRRALQAAADRYDSTMVGRLVRWLSRFRR